MIKHTFFFLFLFLFANYGANSQELNTHPALIIFKTEFSIDKKELKIMSDTIKNDLLNSVKIKDLEKNTVTREEIDSLPDFKQFIENQTSLDIILKYSNGIIWNNKKSANKDIGDYESINLDSNKINFYSRNNLAVAYRTENIPDPAINFTITKNFNDTKILFGYHCYKIILEIQSVVDEGFPFELGNDVYEMFVTDEIKFPIYSLLFINIPSCSFPLEVIKYKSDFKLLKTSIKAFELRQ